VWAGTARHAKAATGYTRQWRTCDKRFAKVCMASTETIAASYQANGMGYKAFRAGRPDSKPAPGERLCLNTSKGLLCTQCMQCKGTTAQTNILVHVHGKGATTFSKVIS